MDFSDAATDGRAPTRTVTDDVWLVIPLYNEDAVVGDVVAEFDYKNMTLTTKPRG